MARSVGVTGVEIGREAGGGVAIAQRDAFGDVRGDNGVETCVGVDAVKVTAQETQVVPNRVGSRGDGFVGRLALGGTAEQVEDMHDRFEPARTGLYI